MWWGWCSAMCSIVRYRLHCCSSEKQLCLGAVCVSEVSVRLDKPVWLSGGARTVISAVTPEYDFLLFSTNGKNRCVVLHIAQITNRSQLISRECAAYK